VPMGHQEDADMEIQNRFWSQASNKCNTDSGQCVKKQAMEPQKEHPLGRVNQLSTWVAFVTVDAPNWPTNRQGHVLCSHKRCT
jgi:hypothetical protein